MGLDARAGCGALETDQRLQVVRIAEILGFRSVHEGAVHENFAVGQFAQDRLDVFERQKCAKLDRRSRSVELQHLAGLADRILAQVDLRMDDERPAVDVHTPNAGRYLDALEPLGLYDRDTFLDPLDEFVLVVRHVSQAGSLGTGLEIPDDFGPDGGPQCLVEYRLADQVVRQCGTSVTFRSVVGVHVPAHLAERDARREGARDRDGGHGPVLLAGGQSFEGLVRRDQIELVLQACSPGLQHHREVREPLGGGHQLLGLLPGHPQRHALVEATLGQQQRPAGAFPESRTEEARSFEGPAQQRLEIGWRDEAQEHGGIHLVLDLHHDGVVVGEHFRPVGKALLPCRFEGQGDGTVHPPSPDGVQDDLAVPGRVPCSRRVRS